jgi:hypothetical protein
VQTVIRDVIGAHPEDYAFATDWEQGAMAAIEKMIAPTSRLLLQEAFTPDLAREEIKNLVTKYGKEEQRQKAAKIKKKKAAEDGEDPVTVQPEKTTRKKKTPIDEDLTRIGLSRES